MDNSNPFTKPLVVIVLLASFLIGMGVGLGMGRLFTIAVTPWTPDTSQVGELINARENPPETKSAEFVALMDRFEELVKSGVQDRSHPVIKMAILEGQYGCFVTADRSPSCNKFRQTISDYLDNRQKTRINEVLNQ